MLYVGAWIALAVVIAIAAGNRGRSALGWFLLAVVISPLIAGLALAILPDLRTRRLLEDMANAGAVDDRALAQAAGFGPKPPNRFLVTAVVLTGMVGVSAMLWLLARLFVLVQ